MCDDVVFKVTVLDCLKCLSSGKMVILCSRDENGTEYMYGSIQILDGVFCCTNTIYTMLKREVVECFYPYMNKDKVYVYIKHEPKAIYNLRL